MERLRSSHQRCLRSSFKTRDARSGQLTSLALKKTPIYMLSNFRFPSPSLRRFAFCLLLLAGGSLGARAADPAMLLTIPRTAHPPTLDGKIGAGEWDDATAVTGLINQFDG